MKSFLYLFTVITFVISQFLLTGVWAQDSAGEPGRSSDGPNPPVAIYTIQDPVLFS